MLADWYFCCCIKASPLRTQYFLLTLDILDTHESDELGVSAAISELCRMDIWMRIYALPRVLKIISSGKALPNITKNTIQVYFSTLQQHVPDSMNNIINKLFSMLLHGMESSCREFIKLLENCFPLLPKTETYLTSKIPYIDLDTFLPQIIILVTVQFLFESRLGEGQLENILKSDIKGKSGLSQMLQKALSGSYGRMCQLTAVHISFTVLNSKPERLLRLLWNQQETDPSLEPDIIAATAAILYGKSDTIEIMAKELITFRCWHDQIDQFIKSSSNRSLILNILGLGSRPHFKHTLPLALWHSVLCDLMVETEPRQAAIALAPIWGPRLPWNNRELKVKAPFTIPDRRQLGLNDKKSSEWMNDAAQKWNERWQKDLEMFAAAQNIMVKVTARPGILSFPHYLQWVIFSPWLRFEIRKNKPYPNHFYWYNPFNLIRLSSAVNTSIRLLIKENNMHELLTFSGLICHASGVLEGFRHGIPDPVGGPAIPKSVGALAMTAQSLVTNAGIGRYSKISTDVFLDLLDTNNALGTISPKTNKISLVENQLVHKIFPENMLIWVSDAYNEATSSLYHERKGLLDDIPRLLDAFSFQAHHIIHTNRSLLIRRFMSNLTSREDPISTDLVISHPHHLLILDNKTPSFWQSHRTELEKSSKKIKTHLVPLIKLVQSIEQISSWGQFGEAGFFHGEGVNSQYGSDYIQDIIQKWRCELLSRLNAVSRPKEMDQFIRLRLIHLLKEPVLSEWPEEQIAIIRVLLEISQGQQLNKLFSSLIILAQTTDGSYEQALLFTVSALERLLKGFSSRIQNIDTKEAPQNPFWTLNKERQYKLLEKTLLGLISGSSYFGEKSWTGLHPILSERIEKLRQESISRLSGITQRIQKVAVRRFQHGAFIPLDAHTLKFVKTNLSVGHWDENHHQAVLLTNVPKITESMINLFSFDRIEAQKQQLLKKYLKSKILRSFLASSM